MYVLLMLFLRFFNIKSNCSTVDAFKFCCGLNHYSNILNSSIEVLASHIAYCNVLHWNCNAKF